jgi:hypothetical protein
MLSGETLKLDEENPELLLSMFHPIPQGIPSYKRDRLLTIAEAPSNKRVLPFHIALRLEQVPHPYQVT